MSASAIADGLIAQLGAASVFGAQNVGKNNYQILETSACAAATIQWVGVNIEHQTFGDFSKGWDFSIKSWVRDLNDPRAALDRVWQYTDKVVNCLLSDETIQGTAKQIDRINGRREPEIATVVGGQSWLPFELVVTIREF